jgi:release factor glutamine methyltransferase
LRKSQNKDFTFKGLTIETHYEVYEPAEDTFLLLDAIKIDKNDRILEIGTGCGIIALDCARHGAGVIGTDSNPYAIELAKRNSQKNQSLLNGEIEFKNSSLFSILKSSEKFDVIIFNPPYLPTKSDEKVGGWFDVAVNGGIDGLEVIEQFLNGVKKHLSKNGYAYFVFSSLSNQKKLNNILSFNRLDAEIISSQYFDYERIDVYFIQ